MSCVGKCDETNMEVMLARQEYMETETGGARQKGDMAREGVRGRMID